MFSLIGPKRYDAPWKDIGPGLDRPRGVRPEVRVTMTDNERMHVRGRRTEALQTVLDGAHQGRRGEVDPGQARGRSDAGDRRLPRPTPTSRQRNSRPGDPGVDKNAEREALFDAFRRGEISHWWCPRWPTSPSTCRKPQWPFRFRDVRVPAGAAAGPAAASQTDGGWSGVLLGGGPRQPRHRLRRAASGSSPSRVRLHHHRRRRSAGPGDLGQTFCSDPRNGIPARPDKSRTSRKRGRPW